MLLVMAAVRISEDSKYLIEFLCDLLLHCDASCDEDAYLNRQKKNTSVFKYILQFYFNSVLVSTSHVNYLYVKINHFF